MTPFPQTHTLGLVSFGHSADSIFQRTSAYSILEFQHNQFNSAEKNYIRQIILKLPLMSELSGVGPV